MRLHIHHTTSYRYETSVAHSTQYLRLTPNDSARQKILSWDLRLPAAASRTLDAYGNVMHVITVDYPQSRDIVIEAEGFVEVDDCAMEKADTVAAVVPALNTTHRYRQHAGNICVAVRQHCKRIPTRCSLATDDALA